MMTQADGGLGAGRGTSCVLCFVMCVWSGALRSTDVSRGGGRAHPIGPATKDTKDTAFLSHHTLAPTKAKPSRRVAGQYRASRRLCDAGIWSLELKCPAQRGKRQETPIAYARLERYRLVVKQGPRGAPPVGASSCAGGEFLTTHLLGAKGMHGRKRLRSTPFIDSKACRTHQSIKSESKIADGGLEQPSKPVEVGILARCRAEGYPPIQ